LYTLPPPIQNNKQSRKPTNDLHSSKRTWINPNHSKMLKKWFIESWMKSSKPGCTLFKKGYNAHLLLLIEVQAMQVMGNLPAKSPRIPPIWCKPGKLYGKRNPTRTKKSLTGKRKKKGRGWGGWVLAKPPTVQNNKRLRGCAIKQKLNGSKFYHYNLTRFTKYEACIFCNVIGTHLLKRSDNDWEKERCWYF